jgi:hypothetical protein
MGDVFVNFLDPLRLHYPLPKHSEGHEDRFFETYLEKLHSFSDDVLKSASGRIIDERKQRSFPLPAECNEACRAAFDDIQFSRQRSSRPNNRGEELAFYDKYPDWTDLRRQQAYALMRCEMGMEAAEDLWVCALFDFCRVNRRLPDRYEKEDIMKTGAKTLDVIGLAGADASKIKDMSILGGQFMQDFFRRHNAICRKIGADNFAIGGTNEHRLKG